MWASGTSSRRAEKHFPISDYTSGLRNGFLAQFAKSVSSKFRQKAREFQKNENGYFAALFGIFSLALIGTSGAVVDFVGVQQARADVQNAMDSVVLALHPLIFTQSEEQLLAQANIILAERMAGTSFVVTVEGAEISQNQGSLFMQARLTVPMHFVALVGYTEMTSRVAAQVTSKSLFQDVVMVLDNSGSMASNARMTNLKIAAASATEILFDGAASQPNLTIGIVPFTFFVNIGSQNANQSWIDSAGNSPIAADNFDDDSDDSTPFTGPVNRLALYNSLSNVSWRGCVEARPHTLTSGGTYLDSDDTTPISSSPATLFVPSFAPDTPDDWATWLNDYIDDNDAPACGPLTGGSNRERQERLCKYSGSISTSAMGPNMDCPSVQTLPLTNIKQNVLDTINAMSASGGTNIHMGAIWGMRVLSPTLPFTQGRPYDTSTAKVMIIMTDGENTTYSNSNMNGASYFTAYGYPYNQRLGAPGQSSSQMKAEMNQRTLQSCTNAKAAGISVYTIGLNPPNQTTRTMLENCATDLSQAFFPQQASELNAVFTQIANELAVRRLAQ